MASLEMKRKLDRVLLLLKEAREQITDKPWEAQTFLHKRISDELGLPTSYPEYFLEASRSLKKVYGVSDWPETNGELFEICTVYEGESDESAIARAKEMYSQELECVVKLSVLNT